MHPSDLPRHVHLIGACGRGMGGIGGALAAMGTRVTGSDVNTYGGTREWLEARGVATTPDFDARNLEPAPDLVVIGRTCGRGNPEVEAVLERRLPYQSLPEFLRDHFLHGRRNLVVAGAKGKTTTTAMLAWILEFAGLLPGYFIGGFTDNFPAPARFPSSDICVIEGDDYSSLWWDDNPKFCYYRPETAIITNIYPDHPEQHGSEAATRRHYECLVNQLPGSGELILGDIDRSPLLAGLAETAPCPVRTVTFGPGQDQIQNFSQGPQGIRFRWSGQDFGLDLVGRMNARNAVAAAMAAQRLGIDAATAAAALRLFRGVHGRLESRGGAGDIEVYCDMAYLPECMEDVFDGLRARHPGRRLVFLWQPFIVDGLPQSQAGLRDAMATCDLLLFCDPYRPLTFKATSGVYVANLAAQMRALGKPVERVGPATGISETVPPHLQPGDVVVTVFHPFHWFVLDELAGRLGKLQSCAS